MTTIMLAAKIARREGVTAPNPISARRDYAWNWLYGAVTTHTRSRARVCRQKWVARYRRKIEAGEARGASEWVEWAEKMRTWLAAEIDNEWAGHCWYDCASCGGAKLEI